MPHPVCPPALTRPAPRSEAARRAFSGRACLAAGLLAAALAAWTATSVAQVVTLERLPTSAVNNPEGDPYGLRRPALSLNGFDSAAPGHEPRHGLGLKQVLERRYNGQDPLLVPVFDRLIEIAHREQADPYAFDDLADRRRQLDRNTSILQGRAFEALVTLALALNGHGAADLARLGLRSHEAALRALTDALARPPGVLILGEDLIDDPVRYGRSLGNVARALDLYLALENAYAEFASETDPGLLLSPEERAVVMGEYGTALLGVDRLLGTRAADVYGGELGLPEAVQDLLLLVLADLPPGDRVVEEVEPGNYMLKLRVAVGYGAMAAQAPPGTDEAAALATLRSKAVRSLEVTGEDDPSRLRHWNFMTFGGKRFWAESAYYLDFALEQALPFWHALRASGGLGTVPDPFFSAWFTNPLHWHADLVTPDGRIAPLDDGNKAPVRYTGLLRWAEGYGDAELGRKYAWVEERLGGPARLQQTLLVELAIPRTATEQAPADRVGTPPGPLVPHASEQQLVVRGPARGGETSYVLLNGEHGKAVDRGEGHEQPDQLQLLYYLGDTSYLLDSGYDRASTLENSTWNHYYDHNALTIGDGEGGLRPPQLRPLQVRKASEPWFMGEVDALYLQEEGQVTLLHGEQPLVAEPWLLYRRADYARDVLVVGAADPGADPYLIDLNTLQYRSRPVFCTLNRLRLRYHAHSDRLVAAGAPVAPGPLAGYDPQQDGFLRWTQIGGQEERTLYAFPVSVEYPFGGARGAGLSAEADVVTEEEAGSKRTVPIQKLTVEGPSGCTPYWSVATLLQARRGGTAAPPARPEPLWPAEASATRQGWVWPQGGEVYDVFVARSVAGPDEPIALRPSQARADFPDLALTLPAEARFGFARVERSGRAWRLDPAYAFGLEAADAPVPTRTEAAPVAADVPSTLALRGAYPNPFNPTTTLRYGVPETGPVTVRVFDALGRRVAVLLASEVRAAGWHEVRFDAAALPSGLYLWEVEAGGRVRTGRITLVR